MPEKCCPYCKKYFWYEENGSQDCSKCVDPQSIPGFTYMKSSLLTLLKKNLQLKAIDTTVFSQEDLKEILEGFPIAWELYTKTTYITFTLNENSPFQNGEFKLGELVRDMNYRHIICLRCGKRTEHSRFMCLWYYIAFSPKLCAKCDSAKIPRNTNGLTGEHKRGKGGRRSKSEYSMRARAKALNISLTDLRRGTNTQKPVLPNGTIVNGLEIIRAFWDDTHNQYCPKYVLKCHKCGGLFSIKQKVVDLVFHEC